MKKKKSKKQFPSMEYWLNLIEFCIAKYSTPPRKRGKYKGHGSTDTLKAFIYVSIEVRREIARVSKGKGYDENMSFAATFGKILCTWYALVHRAKSLDPNRPIRLRKKAHRQRFVWLADLYECVNDDKLMRKVWATQTFEDPFSNNATNGKFV